MRRFILIVSVCGLIAIVLVNLIYRLQNPTLTETQILLQFWWMIPLAIVLVYAVYRNLGDE